MAILELLARAETSSDLSHHTYDCHVDIIGAAGLAAMSAPAHWSIFRVKYLYDAESVQAAKSLFVRWAAAAMKRRGVDPAGASRLGAQTLTYWLDDVCPKCHGQKMQLIPGTPSLSDRPCPSCGGSGSRRIPGRGAQLEVVRDVIDRADAAVLMLQRAINDRRE